MEEQFDFEKAMADAYDEIIAVVSRHRGYIIELMTQLEDSIDLIISDIYCQNDGQKRREFQHLFLASQSFNLQLKVAAINFILDNYFPDILKRNLKFKEWLDEMVTKRNHYAHRKFEIFQQKLNPLDKDILNNIFLSYEKTKDGKPRTVPIKIDKETFSSDANKITYLIAVLDNVIGEREKGN